MNEKDKIINNFNERLDLAGIKTTATYNHMVVDLPNKGFKMEAKDKETFERDGAGWGVLTDFFIELVDLGYPLVIRLLRKYKITIRNKPE